MGRPRSGVRPTTAKVAEALFQIVEHAKGGFEGLCVLDVCAGTGQVGLGALERGAAQAVFVEKSATVAGELRGVLRGSGQPGRVVQGNAASVLEKLDGPFDLIFIDPPYGTSVAADCLELVGRRGLLSPSGMVIVEHHHKDAVCEAYGPLARYRQQRYGETAVSFYAQVGIGLGPFPPQRARPAALGETEELAE